MRSMNWLLNSPAARGTALLTLGLLAYEPPPSLAASPAYDDDAAIVHALNRLAYGPRPGDVDRVRQVGLLRWIEQQLEPEHVPDPALRPRLAALKTVGLTTHELMKGYEIPPAAQLELAKQRADMENASDSEKGAARRAVLQKDGASMDGHPRQVLNALQ